MITPGPVVITVAFIGYLVAGPLGACAAAIGVFLPAYLLKAQSSNRDKPVPSSTKPHFQSGNVASLQIAAPAQFIGNVAGDVAGPELISSARV